MVNNPLSLIPRLYDESTGHGTTGASQCFAVPLTIELRPKSSPTQGNFLTGFLVPTSEVCASFVIMRLVCAFWPKKKKREPVLSRLILSKCVRTLTQLFSYICTFMYAFKCVFIHVHTVFIQHPHTFHAVCPYTLIQSMTRCHPSVTQ